MSRPCATATPGRRSQVRVRWTALARLSFAALLAGTGCTFGPEEDRASIGQVVRVPDSYQAFVVVQYERIRRPTGLSTFPDGGKWRFLRREARLYAVDARKKLVTEILRIAAPDSVWESFSLSVSGFEGDSVAYLRTYGCPRGGECYPTLANTARMRVTRTGDIQPIRDFPPGTGLPGTMLAREVGEQKFVRLSVRGSAITGTFQEDAPYEPLFHAQVDGSLVPASQ